MRDKTSLFADHLAFLILDLDGICIQKIQFFTGKLLKALVLVITEGQPENLKISSMDILSF